MTIHVLDDDHALCHVLETLLALAGYEVSTHTDPLAFLEFTQRTHPECVIVDFRLTGEQTGLDIIAQVRQTHPSLPAVLISGDPLPEMILQDFSNAVFCRKPFHIATILDAVSHLRDKPEMLATVKKTEQHERERIGK